MQTHMPRHALLLPQLTISKKKVCTSYHGLQSPQRPDLYLDSWPPYHTLGSLLTVTAVFRHLCDSSSNPSPGQLLPAVFSPQKASFNTFLASLCPFPLAPTPILTLTGREFLLWVHPASCEHSPNTQTVGLPRAVNA